MYAILKTNKLVAINPRALLKNNYSCYCKQWKVRGQVLPCPFLTPSALQPGKQYSTRQSMTAEYFTSNYDPIPKILYSKNSFLAARHFSVSNVYFESEPLKPSSKVEETVQTLKKQKETEAANITETSVKKVVAKKSIKQRIMDELIHYYHGFRLLFIDINVSRKLIGRILNGKTLSRREHKLLVRTSGDVFRLIPFSVFIIVPFMEFLLPVAIKLFPGMLPSTFETNTEKEDKMRQSLKVKLEMAKFLQQTLDEMAPQSKEHHSELAKEFNDFFIKIRSTGEQPTNEEIMRFGKLFEDEITLDSLVRPQLVALCRVLEVNTIGTSAILRFNLRMKLRSLAADDKMIAKEGVKSLTLSELQQACRARGMRAYGMPEERLRAQLESWLDLSLNEKVPPSLLLLSRALMIPENVPTSDKLKASISILPENVVVAQKAAISEKEGKIDHKAKIEAIKEEERKIQEERMEQREEAARLKKEEAQDKAPILQAAATEELKDTAPVITQPEKKEPKKEEGISVKDIEIIEDAIDTLGKNKRKLLLEKEELADLKEEMADYQEDVQELKEITRADKSRLQETKGARRLFNKVNSMISKMDVVLANLEKEKVKLNLENGQSTDKPAISQEQLVHIDELMMMIKKIRNVPDDSKMMQIQHILGRLDDDFDGQLKVEDVLKVIETIGKENVNLSQKQVGELIELLDKEELLDVENKIQKALEKEEKLAQEQEQTREKTITLDETTGGITAQDLADAVTKENLLKEAEKQKALMEAIEKQKEAILPKIEPQEVQAKPVEGVQKKETTNDSSKTL